MKLEALEDRWVPATLQVGPGLQYALPSQAAAAAHDGDVIQISASGNYAGNFATWNANNLTIQGVGGQVRLNATGFKIPNRKAIWVINGNNTTVSNIEFFGAHDSAGLDKNWAGIRQQGSSLTLVNCYFHNNDDGILVNANATSNIVIRQSEFAFNGYGDGYSHNMYIGQVKSFTLQDSYSHDANVGHLVKSRAQQNFILYNKLVDGKSGKVSYELDLPNGGATYVIGNVIEQSALAANPTMLAYAEEGAANAVQQLYVVNNTFANDLHSGTFVLVKGTPSAVRVANNIFAFGGKVLSGPGTLTTNLVSNNPGFVNAAAYDYHLTSGSLAINAGTSLATVNAFSPMPIYQYADPLNQITRAQHGVIDIGAFEY